MELRGWDPTYQYPVFKYRLRTLNSSGVTQKEIKFEVSMHIGDWAVVDSHTAYVVVKALCGFYGCPKSLQAAVLKLDLDTGRILSTKNIIPGNERNVTQYFFLLPATPDLTLKWQTYKKNGQNIQYIDQSTVLSREQFSVDVTGIFGH